MTDCQEKGLTCVVTGVPPSTTSDWLARSQTQQVRWALDQTEWSITMWTEESGSRVWLNLRCSVSVSGFLSPGLWSFPVFSFWCLALQTHEWPHEGRFSKEWRQKLLHHAIAIPWTCAKHYNRGVGGHRGVQGDSPLLLEGIFQHFDSSHQVLFHVLLPFPLSLQKCHLSLEIYTHRDANYRRRNRTLITLQHHSKWLRAHVTWFLSGHGSRIPPSPRQRNQNK